MALSSRYRGKVLVVTAHMTHIDAAVAIQFKDEIRAEIDDAAQHVILDLAEVDFIDSSGLGAIVASMKQLKGDKKTGPCWFDTNRCKSFPAHSNGYGI